MELRNGKRTLDAYRPTFDPHLDIATVVFSHVQCVKTRGNLTLVSKLWRDASKPAAAYPLVLDWGALLDMSARYRMQDWTRWFNRVLELMDNDEALSLPYERVVGLLGEAAKNVCNHAASRGSVRLLKWAHENNLVWSTYTCSSAARTGKLPALQYLHENGCPWNSNTCTAAAISGHLPTLQYVHENGCPWDSSTCAFAAHSKHWDCLQYAVDNKAPGWEIYAERHAKHFTYEMSST
jgi:hypothetical protein